MLKNLLSGVVGIGVGLLLGALIMAVQGYNPITTYGALFTYSLFGLFPLATTLNNAVPLILTGLSASVAFVSGPVNLGQPGQLVMGALLATVVGIYVTLPAPLMIPLLIAAAMVGGALWGWRFGTTTQGQLISKPKEHRHGDKTNDYQSGTGCNTGKG